MGAKAFRSATLNARWQSRNTRSSVFLDPEKLRAIHRRSKFKVLEPTKLQDLRKYAANRYKELDPSDLDSLTEGDLVKVIYGIALAHL